MWYTTTAWSNTCISQSYVACVHCFITQPPNLRLLSDIKYFCEDLGCRISDKFVLCSQTQDEPYIQFQ